MVAALHDVEVGVVARVQHGRSGAARDDAAGAQRQVLGRVVPAAPRLALGPALGRAPHALGRPFGQPPVGGSTISEVRRFEAIVA